MQMTSSVSRVEYSRTFILSLFVCYKTSKVYGGQFGKHRQIEKKIKNVIQVPLFGHSHS